MKTDKDQRSETSARTLKALWLCFDTANDHQLARLLCALARCGVENPLDLFLDHPLADDWRDFATVALRSHLRRRQGIVYVVGNPVNVGCYKIGVTSFSLEKRLRSLKTSGVIGEFIEVDKAYACDRYAAEMAAHKRMSEMAPRHKEFFVCHYQAAIDVMQAAVQEDNECLRKAFRLII